MGSGCSLCSYHFNFYNIGKSSSFGWWGNAQISKTTLFLVFSVYLGLFEFPFSNFTGFYLFIFLEWKCREKKLDSLVWLVEEKPIKFFHLIVTRVWSFPPFQGNLGEWASDIWLEYARGSDFLLVEKKMVFGRSEFGKLGLPEFHFYFCF